MLAHRLLSALAVALLAAAASAQPQPTEQAVKAAFLPKFVRYVEWPAGAVPAPGAPIQLCLIGQDPFGRLIDQAVMGQAFADHQIVVRRVPSAAAASDCQLAFVNSGSSRGNAQALAALAGRPVLTVTDARGGAAQGMVHFTLQDGRVRFHIDDAAARRSNLAISSRLLGLALSVRSRRS